MCTNTEIMKVRGCYVMTCRDCVAHKNFFDESKARNFAATHKMVDFYPPMNTAWAFGIFE